MIVFGAAACLGIVPIGSSIVAQSAPIAAARTWTSADSLRYVRDSTTIDSLSRLVPVDSIRRLYQQFVGASDAPSALFALQCERYRLWYVFGHAGEIAEDRVRVQEWQPELFPRIRASFEAAIPRATIPRIPTHRGCGIPDDAPFAPDRLRYAPIVPWRPAYVNRGSSLDVVRRGETLFEGTLRAHIGNQDTSIMVAGSATLGLRSPQSFELRLDDKLNRDIVGFYFRLSPSPFFYRGTYPILESEDARDIPWAIGGYMQTGPIPLLVTDYWRGTLTVEKADSDRVEGRVSFITVGYSVDRRNLHTPLIGSPRDTVHFEGWFRAKYDKSQDLNLVRIPELPRRFDPRISPDAHQTLARIFLDDTVPCEKLPVYVRDSTVALEPAPRRSVRAAVEIRLDSTGKAWPGGVHIRSVSERVAFDSLGPAPLLRFRRPSADQALRKVRCLLTLPLR